MVQTPHESGQAKVGYFTDQVGVNQHVPRCQVPVDKVSLREVAHPCTNSSEHPNKLEDTELTLVLLEELEGRGKGEQERGGDYLVQSNVKCIQFYK